jgi:hypothetical protein
MANRRFQGGGRGGRGGRGRGGDRGGNGFGGGGYGEGGGSRNRGGGGRRHGGGGGRRGRSSNPRQSAESGNKRERIAIESGALVILDQFMLANPQFIERVKAVINEAPEAKDMVIQDYGGIVVDIEPGTYKIERDPFAFSIVIHPEGSTLDTKELTKDSTESRGQVFIDTRCVAMIDRELLDDTSLLEKYQQLWFGGQDKACRDLIRDNGGAVRYGFNRYGDELGIFVKSDEDVVCLWPEKLDEGLAPSAPVEEGVAN